MLRRSRLAYGLMGLFFVLYVLSMFLPGFVLNDFVQGHGGLSPKEAIAALEEGRPCWVDGGEDVHLTKDRALVDAHGTKIKQQPVPLFTCRDPEHQSVYYGYRVLAEGAFGVLVGIYAWYANALALITLALGALKKPKMAALCAFCGVVVGLDAFRFTGLPSINVPGPSLDHLGIGYYVWEASLLMLLLSQIVTIKNRRAETRQGSAVP